MKEQLRQHQKSKKHQANSSLKRPLVQSPLEFKDPKAKRQCTREEEVGQELCDALLAANILFLVKTLEPKFCVKFQKLSMVSGDQGELPEFWSASDAASLKYCPVQSVDV